MTSHYAPGKPVRLNAQDAEADEFHIGFGAVAGAMNLSPSGDLAEAAAIFTRRCMPRHRPISRAWPWRPCRTATSARRSMIACAALPPDV
jgi:hypothetical protein